MPDIGQRGYLRGNEVVWDGQHWRTANGADAERAELRCPQCGALHGPSDHDACIGTIPGAEGACCGHGKHLGYVNWPEAGVGPDWQQRAYVGA